MKATFALVVGFVLGLAAADRMTSGLVKGYSAELARAQQLAGRRGELLDRAHVRWQLSVDAANVAVLAAQRACRTPLRRGEVAPFATTAYSIGCDAPGPRTRAGTTPVEGHTVAADPAVLPIGSLVRVEGLGELQVHDVGGGVRGRHLDVFLADCARASAWGRQVRDVEVLHVPTKAPRG